MNTQKFDLVKYMKNKLQKYKNYWTLTSNLNIEESDYDIPYIIVSNLISLT